MTGATNFFVSVVARLFPQRFVSFPVKVFNTVRQLTVHLIDSDTPLLIARPTLEEWCIVCFRNKRIQLLDEPELGWKISCGFQSVR